MSNADIEKYHVASGRMLKENNVYINIADVASRYDRLLNGINSLQVSEAYPVISLKSNYGLSVLRDVVTETGSGTVTNVIGDGFYTVSSGTTPGSLACLESVERGRYVSGAIANPGLGVRIPVAPTGDAVVRWGYYSAETGFGYGLDSAGLFLFRRMDGIDEVVRQEDWDDPMDGTGFSGHSIIATDYNIYTMPFRWYGAGPVEFSVSGTGTSTDTDKVHVLYATDELITSDPNLQLRAEVDNGTTSQDLIIEIGGRQFSILGRYEPNRRITGEYRLTQSVGTTFVPLITFRQKANFASVSVKSGSIDLLSANADLIYQIRVNATLTGAVYGTPRNSLSTETALESDFTATAITGGLAIFTGLAGSGVGANTAGSGRDIPEVDLPVNENITLCARAVSGTATVTSSFRAKEEW